MDKTYFIDVKFHPHNPKGIFLTRTPVKGTLTFTPDKDVTLKQLGYRVIYEVRGKLSGYNTFITKQTFAEMKSVRAGESLKYTFEFTIEKFETYFGVNAELLIKFIPVVDIETWGTKSFKKMLSSLNPFSNYVESGTTYLEFQKENPRLSPSPEPEELSLNFLWQPTFILIGLAAMLFAQYHFEFSFYYIFVPLGIILTTMIGHFAAGKYLIGRTTVRFSLAESGDFIGYLENTTNWQAVKQLFTHLECTEKVVDRRGTSSTTYSEQIYESDQLHFSKPQETLRLTFKVPSDKPPTLEYEDLEIYWTIKVIIDTIWKLSYTFESRIYIRKTEIPNA